MATLTRVIGTGDLVRVAPGILPHGVRRGPWRVTRTPDEYLYLRERYVVLDLTGARNTYGGSVGWSHPDGGEALLVARGQVTLLRAADADGGTDADGGEQVALADLADLDLRGLWESVYPVDEQVFLTVLRARLEDPDEADEVVFCEDCGYPTHPDDVVSVRGGDSACQTCVDEDYFDCRDCGETTNEPSCWDDELCESCSDTYYRYCEECDVYYHGDDGGHEHAGCDCPPPGGLTFAIRNDGEPDLANDVRVQVSLPAGTISEEGLNAIIRTLHDTAYRCTDNVERDRYYALAADLAPLGDQWQTRQGNWTKRLSSHAYKTHNLRLPSALLSTVGCIARDHSTAVDFHVEVTRDLNLPAVDFYHEDSCWWGGYSESRCVTKSHGGFGLRTFGEDPWRGNGVTGRAWAMPLRHTGEESCGRAVLVPTFDTLTPDALIVYNGYGALSGYVPARILSHMYGWTYRKVYFYATPMYVNNERGYLVAREEIAAPYTDGTLNLGELDIHSSLYNTEGKVLSSVA